MIATAIRRESLSSYMAIRNPDVATTMSIKKSFNKNDLQLIITEKKWTQKEIY